MKRGIAIELKLFSPLMSKRTEASKDEVNRVLERVNPTVEFTDSKLIGLTSSYNFWCRICKHPWTTNPSNVGIDAQSIGGGEPRRKNLTKCRMCSQAKRGFSTRKYSRAEVEEHAKHRNLKLKAPLEKRYRVQQKLTFHLRQLPRGLAYFCNNVLRK